MEIYKLDQLWDDVPGREHNGYPRFTYKEVLTKPYELKAKISKLSKKLDRDRYVLEVAGYVAGQELVNLSKWCLDGFS